MLADRIMHTSCVTLHAVITIVLSYLLLRHVFLNCSTKSSQ